MNQSNVLGCCSWIRQYPFLECSHGLFCKSRYALNGFAWQQISILQQRSIERGKSGEVLSTYLDVNGVESLHLLVLKYLLKSIPILRLETIFHSLLHERSCSKKRSIQWTWRVNRVDALQMRKCERYWSSSESERTSERLANQILLQGPSVDFIGCSEGRRISTQTQLPLYNWTEVSGPTNETRSLSGYIKWYTFGFMYGNLLLANTIIVSRLAMFFHSTCLIIVG